MFILFTNDFFKQLYGLFYHDNTDLQTWAHQHLLAVVSTPIPGLSLSPLSRALSTHILTETDMPSLAPELQQAARDTSAWTYISCIFVFCLSFLFIFYYYFFDTGHIFEEDDPPQVRVGSQVANISRVFGTLLAWDVLVQFLSSNVKFYYFILFLFVFLSLLSHIYCCIQNSHVRSQVSSVFLREGSPAPITVLLQNVFKCILFNIP